MDTLLQNSQLLILVVPIVVIIAVLILQKPIIGIYITSFSIPFEDLTTLLEDVTVIKLVVAYTFLVWISKEILQRKKIELYQLRYIALLIIWAMLSLGWNVDMRSSIRYLSTFVQLVLFALMTVNILRSEREITYVLVLYVIASTITSAMSIVLTSRGVLVHNRAAYIEGQNPNGFSRSIGLALLFLIYLVQKNEYKHRVFLYLGGILIILAIILAQSRGTYVAISVSVALIVLFSSFRYKWQTILLCVGSFGLVYYLFPGIISNSILPRVETVYTDGSMAGREVIWTVAWEMIKANPIVGVGFGNFTKVYGQFTLSLRGWYAETDPHNVYVAIQTELGIVGTLFLALFMYSILKRIIRIEKSFMIEKLWGFAVFLYIFVGAMANSLHYSKFFWFGIAILVALINLEGLLLPEKKDPSESAHERYTRAAHRVIQKVY